VAEFFRGTILRVRPVPRFVHSESARRGATALLLAVLVVAGATLVTRLISGFFSSLPPSRGFLNASSFTFVSFVILTVLYGRLCGPTDVASKPNYLVHGKFVALALIVISVVVTIAYVPGLSDPFLFDDYKHLSNSSSQPWGEMITNAFFVRPTDGDFSFRPVGYISYWLDYRWAGYESLRWHLWNVLVHAANSILVFVLARQLKLSRVASVFAGLVFAVHASHAEVTGWMAARFDLLAFLFSLLALIALIQFVDYRKPVWFAMMVLATLLALLSKEAAFSLPLMALCLIPFRRIAARSIVKLAGMMAAICAIVFTYRGWLLGGIGGYQMKNGTPTILNFNLLRTLNALLFRLWGLLLFPLNWSVLPEKWLIAAALLMLLLMAAALFLAVLHADRLRLIASLGLILAAALPVQHLLLISSDLAGGRFLYLPTLGLALFWGILLQGCDKPKFAIVLGASLIVFQWGALQHNLRVRTEVAHLSQRACVVIGEELRRDARPLLVEGVPKIWEGVYFLSNGFIPCVAIQAGAPAITAKLYVGSVPAAAAAQPSPRIFIWSTAAETFVETRPPVR
jgi:hypothetical protein